MDDNYQPPQDNALSRALLWLASLVSLGGIVYFWINMDSDDFWLKVIAVGLVGVIWIGVVFAVMAFIALLLGMAGIVVSPFRRR